MSVIDFIDNCRFVPTAGALTDFTVSAAVLGYQTPAQAGAVDSSIYRYRAESGDLTQWEIGYGAYIVSSALLARTTVTASSSGGAKVNFSSVPQVALVTFAADQTNDYRNLIINGDFRFNQRGYVSAATLASGAFGHDRWKGGAAGGDYSFTQLSTSTQITVAANKTLQQIIEDKNIVGGTYVLSWSGTCQARVGINGAAPAGSYAAGPIVLTGVNAGQQITAEFGNGAATGTLGLVQLELGATPTIFERTPFAIEHARCLRYFSTNFPLGTAPANHTISVDYFFSAYTTGEGATQFIPFAVPMRTTPTMTYYSSAQTAAPPAGQWQYFDAAWTDGNTTVSLNRSSLGFSGDFMGTFTVNNSYICAGGWTADAEI